MISTTKAVRPFSVAGSDLDSSLVSRLTMGDKVMIEANGARIYSESGCPLLAETSWEVLANNPPPQGVRPTKDNQLILLHKAEKHELRLHYKNIVRRQAGEPAIFRTRDRRLATDEKGDAAQVLVILQMISHQSRETDFPTYNLDDTILLLEDADLRHAILVQWQELFATFPTQGWSNKTISRLSLRAFVSPMDIMLIRSGDGYKVGVETLVKIHEALFWLPYQLDASRVLFERSTFHRRHATVANPRLSTNTKNQN